MTVKAALQLINRELDEYLGGIQGEFDPDTRFAITWFEQNGLKAGDYGTANSIAQARGVSVESVRHAGIVEGQAGKVRILARDELDDKWDPDQPSQVYARRPRSILVLDVSQPQPHRGGSCRAA